MSSLFARNLVWPTDSSPETYSTVHGYTIPGKVEKLEETFDGKEESSEEKMPWDD